jgi:hypothetical protein
LIHRFVFLDCTAGMSVRVHCLPGALAIWLEVVLFVPLHPASQQPKHSIGPHVLKMPALKKEEPPFIFTDPQHLTRETFRPSPAGLPGPMPLFPSPLHSDKSTSTTQYSRTNHLRPTSGLLSPFVCHPPLLFAPNVCPPTTERKHHLASIASRHLRRLKPNMRAQ